MTLWHKMQHKFGWWSGHVVSRTDKAGRIFIGFQCNDCNKTFSEHDATAFIDRRIKNYLQTGVDL